MLLRPRGDVARLVWIYTVGMLGFMSMTAILPLYLGDAFGITEESVGPFFVYIGFLSIVMRAVVLGRLVDRFGETRVMRMGALTLAAGLLTIPLPESVFASAAFMSLVPIGTAMLFPSVSALVSHRAPAEELGQTLGVQQSFGGVSRVIAPLWSTAVYQSAGISIPFFIAGGVVLIVAVLAMRVRVAGDWEVEPDPEVV